MTTVDTAQRPTPDHEPTGGLDRFFRISERGSSVQREVRGGFATFFTMAYIVVLNPIILGSAKDSLGHSLSVAQLTTSTALVAAVMTAIMGLVGNLPLAIATGLGLNSLVAFTIAPTMSWPDAMGLVVIEGLGIVLLVATGLRQTILEAIPLALKQAISVGIGLFIAFIGLVDAGFVTTPKGASVPVQLGATGRLNGWPVLVFAVGLLLTIVLLVRRVRGAILISIIVSTVLAVVINAFATVTTWGLITPKVPASIVGKPDFGLLGHFSLGGGFAKAGIVTRSTRLFSSEAPPVFPGYRSSSATSSTPWERSSGSATRPGCSTSRGGCPGSARCCSSTASPRSSSATERQHRSPIRRWPRRGRADPCRDPRPRWMNPPGFGRGSGYWIRTSWSGCSAA